MAGALRALVLRAGFDLAGETVADLADAGIWMLAFVLSYYTCDRLTDMKAAATRNIMKQLRPT